LALIAFAFQNYVAQTHVHLTPASTFGTSKFAAALSAPEKSSRTVERNAPNEKAPASDDPARCPLCQAVGHAGQFVWPSAAAFILPQLSAAIVPVTSAVVRTADSDSHNWQSRAPPRL
jgi:hypothetical protein